MKILAHVPVIKWFATVLTRLQTLKELSEHGIPAVWVGRRVATMLHSGSTVNVDLPCCPRYATIYR